jgi:membrane protein
MIVLLGAEINAEAEHQTEEDTTKGPPKPLGQRGAVVADAPAPAPH